MATSAIAPVRASVAQRSSDLTGSGRIGSPSSGDRATQAAAAGRRRDFDRLRPNWHQLRPELPSATVTSSQSVTITIRRREPNSNPASAFVGPQVWGEVGLGPTLVLAIPGGLACNQTKNQLDAAFSRDLRAPGRGMSLCPH